MKTKIFYILTTAVITLTAFYIGRNTAPHTTTTTTKVIHTMPEKVNLSDDAQFDYIDTFLGSITDWNTDGKEMAIMTKDGYELYLNKQASIYQLDLKQYIGMKEFASWTIDGNILTITTSDGNTYTFNK